MSKRKSCLGRPDMRTQERKNEEAFYGIVIMAGTFFVIGLFLAIAAVIRALQ